MPRQFVFASESVGEGHPDKVCDTISDAILDACLVQDEDSRVACEIYAKSNLLVIGGEITTRAKVAYNDIARRAIREIGYVDDDDVFHADKILILNAITKQSEDIARGITKKASRRRVAEQCAGDQGLMFGYACIETPELMPAPIMFAHRLGYELTRLRKQGGIGWLRPDTKSQVSVVYTGNKPTAISSVVVSTQHTPDISQKEIKSFVTEEVVWKVLPLELLNSETRLLVNPTGNFVVGGPQGDAGLTGRKIIVDTYGGMGRHGGGAFSGKDPSKVDRSAAYMGRYVAKNVVAAQIADQCEVQLAYAIGCAEPVSLHVNTFGTSKIDEARIEAAVKAVFGFRPAEITKQLGLLRPIYSKTTNYGHFGKVGGEFSWERTDKIEALREAIK
ncbi:S-adenosylmethionine synthase [Candidatus Xiphinematobacter sp. Idaho Grape]|uniref:methionine adenosyltransferase n=1 Tax=Candidatus Xiphinematobacter sp. Idaho Grape TaxID=1704307 RepID=UPI000705E621|nr:methionine adenosyltransferase [Candidatus Xiphinematobacter sp. Idaho Grape]ALJ56377.1 S-adenosylmethionine synthase [Candidatus Xiphinematobacter sp. Idaho Grape]